MAYRANSQSGYSGHSRNSGFNNKRFRGNKNQQVNREYGFQGLSQGSLTDYGWRATLPDDVRHQALEMMVQAEGSEAVKQKLQVMFGIGLPQVDQVIQQDLEFIASKEATE